ncbi:MAG: TIGR02452 family protein [Clostridia bacterium]|nr:TIGR02452 family protein [Clostridia bacterium]
MLFDLIKEFNNTQALIQEDPELAALTEETTRKSWMYRQGFRAENRTVKNQEFNITVTDRSTFEEAALHVGEGRICALNFANAYNPGGGVERGARAQEEDLCRTSNLYNAITRRYFIENYYGWNRRNTGDLGTDNLIYSPGVTVFKNDDYSLKAREDWFRTDVITCAAPHLHPEKTRPVPRGQLVEAFDSRIVNILEAAIENDADVLILGAFGCGAFNNPPALVSDCFRYVLLEKDYAKYFRSVIFAVKKGSWINRNYEVFSKVLQAPLE